MLRSQIETMSASWTEPSSSLKGGKKVSAALTENHDERSPSADLICRPVLVRLWTVPARVPATCTDATLPEGVQAVICMVVTESRFGSAPQRIAGRSAYGRAATTCACKAAAGQSEGISPKP